MIETFQSRNQFCSKCVEAVNKILDGKDFTASDYFLACDYDLIVMRNGKLYTTERYEEFRKTSTSND